MELKLGYLDALLSRKPHARLMLMGHSVGAYVLMQVRVAHCLYRALLTYDSPRF